MSKFFLVSSLATVKLGTGLGAIRCQISLQPLEGQFQETVDLSCSIRLSATCVGYKRHESAPVFLSYRVGALGSVFLGGALPRFLLLRSKLAIPNIDL